MLARLLITTALLSLSAPAQSPKAHIEKLVPPIYPPIAKAARVTGDVDIALTFNLGAPTTLAVVNGPPMLHQSALDSASQSSITCDGCFTGNDTAHLFFVYRLVGQEDAATNQTYPQITQTDDRITIIANALIISDPSPDMSIRARSPKCLYLWHWG